MDAFRRHLLVKLLSIPPHADERDALALLTEEELAELNAWNHRPRPETDAEESRFPPDWDPFDDPSDP